MEEGHQKRDLLPHRFHLISPPRQRAFSADPLDWTVGSADFWPLQIPSFHLSVRLDKEKITTQLYCLS